MASRMLDTLPGKRITQGTRSLHQPPKKLKTCRTRKVLLNLSSSKEVLAGVGVGVFGEG